MMTKRPFLAGATFVASVFGLLSLLAMPAHANVLTGATATVDCNGFTVVVGAFDLNPGTVYQINISFTLTPASGSPLVVPATISFTAPNNGQISEGTSGSWPAPLTQPYTVTGSATLTSNGSTVPILFNGANSTLLSCGGTACPATIGFWKHHPFPTSVQTSGLTIAGVTYSPADLLTILNATGSGNAVAILGKQLVGALLNLAAGARHNSTADAAIADAETLLQSNSLNLLTSVVDASSSLGQELLADESILDRYNSADFNTCSEGSGLQTNTP